MKQKPRIAHLAGSNATIANSAALVTSNKARAEHGLPVMRDESGKPIRFDALRPQRLAAPAKVYVEQFSAHPLERDAAELYGPPEVLGRDFFPYRPSHLAVSPPRGALATITNAVQGILASGKYAGAIWTQGSPRIEETLYWLNLLIDSVLPICGNSSQRVHGMIGNEGDKNLVDAAEFIASRAWADDAGRNRLGVVLVQEQRIFAARDVQKGDARPGGYVVTGGHGGILGAVGHEGPPTLTYLPVRKHTYQSEVNLSRLPRELKNQRGELLPEAIPKVSIVKEANYYAEGDDAEDDADLVALMERNARRYPLSGFVLEGHAPYGTTASASRTRLLKTAVQRGMPVVIVGRGNNEGFTAPQGTLIGGRNPTPPKGPLLPVACLMRFGARSDFA